MSIRLVITVALAVFRTDALVSEYLGRDRVSAYCEYGRGYTVCPIWKSFHKYVEGANCEDINFITKNGFFRESFEKYRKSNEQSLPCIRYGPRAIANLERAKKYVEIRHRIIVKQDQYLCYPHRYKSASFSWINTSNEEFAYYYCYSVLRLLRSDSNLRKIV